MTDSYLSSGVAGLGLVVFHLIIAVALWKMAERTKVEPRWFALVPLLNILLFLKLAGKPSWWLALFLIPIVNIAVLVTATMSLCARFGLNKWWGLTSIVSPINLGLYLYIAYGTKVTPVGTSTSGNDNSNLLSGPNRGITLRALAYAAGIIFLISISDIIVSFIIAAFFGRL